jgi:hypothetical protein
MTLRTCAALLLATLMIPGLATAADRSAAVLLLPESDMDRELADDLTEVLVSAVIEKSQRSYRMQGKESFRSALQERKASSGDLCVKEVECVRQAAVEMAIDLVLFGKVGKAANGYRLEVWMLAPGSEAEKPYRKRVEGDVGILIEEMEAVAVWALAPRNTSLTLTITPAGAKVTVDDQPVADATQPVPVALGDHTVAASATGFQAASVKVTCTANAPCEATLALTKAQGKTPEKPIEKPKPVDDGPEQVSTGTIVAASVLGGVALLAGGGSVYLYTQMKQAETDANDLIDTYCPDGINCSVTEGAFFDEFDPIVERGEKNALLATVLAGVAGASAVAAVTVLVIDIADGPNGPAPKKTVFQPHISPDFTGATFGVTF